MNLGTVREEGEEEVVEEKRVEIGGLLMAARRNYLYHLITRVLRRAAPKRPAETNELRRNRRVRSLSFSLKCVDLVL